MHGFQSDVAMLAVDLPENLDASPTRPVGRAAWLSLGAALLRSAAAHLQIDASELASGVRPWVHHDGRILGEVFVHDTLPNGAGYAEEVAGNVEAILRRAHELCAHCPGRCETACYRCLLDYGNQRQHGLLDRHLVRSLLGYVLDGSEPEISRKEQLDALRRLEPFVPPEVMRIDARIGDTEVPATISLPGGRRYSLWPLHPLRLPPKGLAAEVARETGTVALFPNEFDLIRRPFWVWNGILNGRTGRL
ncbi:MAG: hypothetical protein CYG60_12130 [Actinobacteria bacterium]|nr:MAG: hypothetical protein CYG60_12130 [Actinomycetota bacterium]